MEDDAAEETGAAASEMRAKCATDAEEAMKGRANCGCGAKVTPVRPWPAPGFPPPTPPTPEPGPTAETEAETKAVVFLTTWVEGAGVGELLGDFGGEKGGDGQ